MDFRCRPGSAVSPGTIVAVALYVPAIRIIERRLRAQSGPQTLEQRAAFEDKLSVVRRVIFGIDIAILATLGYWIGSDRRQIRWRHERLI